MFSCSLDLQIGCLISSAIYGVATTPNDFATYLLAILIVNGLLYLAFYVIMKVLLSRFAFFFHELNIPHSRGRMGTSPGHSDFWIVWGGQAFVMIGRWYSRQPLTNFKSNACPPSRSQKLLRRKLVPIPPMDNYELPYKILFSRQLTISFHNNVPVIFCFV